jgi:hypothetical protein
VSGLELLDDRDDRGGLCLVALETTDLQRESAAIDQQPNHDLWIDPPLLGETDLAQAVFLLRLEVQGLCRPSGYADLGCVAAGQVAGTAQEVGII